MEDHGQGVVPNFTSHTDRASTFEQIGGQKVWNSSIRALPTTKSTNFFCKGIRRVDDIWDQKNSSCDKLKLNFTLQAWWRKSGKRSLGKYHDNGATSLRQKKILPMAWILQR